MNGICAIALVLLGQTPVKAANPALLTVAEKSGYKATARHAEVVALCEALAKAYPKTIRVGELGVTHEGRKLPMLILAEPPIADADSARRSGKLVVFAMGNIHAGEVDGKEALPMLARDIAASDNRGLLKNVILVFAPIYNADGNERVSPTNRPGQVGPEAGMGVRHNAQGLDLNRDFIKLDAPETRSLVRFLNKWDPAIAIDCHTTNGSYHRYAITYDVPRHPLAGAKLTTFAKDVFAPAIAARFEKLSGKKSFYYGNFNRDKTRWEIYGNEPRFSTQYISVRKRIGVLSEAYAYLPFKDRVLVTRDFVRGIAEYASEHAAEIRAVIGEPMAAAAAPVKEAPQREPRPEGRRRNGRPAEQTAKTASKSEPAATARRPAVAAPPRTIALRTELAKSADAIGVLGFVEETSKDGKRKSTTQAKEYKVEHWATAKATLTVNRPAAYIVPAKYLAAIQNLQRHGIAVQELREDIDMPVEVQRVTAVKRSPMVYQKHKTVKVETTTRATTLRVPAGSLLVDVNQPLGDLASFVLEPRSEDGLCTWNFFDDGLAEGADFPVLRVVAQPPVLAVAAAALPEDERPPQPITPGMATGFGSMRQLSGSPVLSVQWIDDEHFTQFKQNRNWKIEAATGKAEPYAAPRTETKLADSLAKLPTIGAIMARGLAARATVDGAKVGAFVEYETDLYYGKLDGSFGARLTKTPGLKELVRFSPDGKFVSFVREGNLYVVDVATQAERALTTDGGGAISNGKTDWVYFEEINNRNWNAYWWSPDSKRIAFLRFDDKGVLPFTVVNHLRPRQTLEITAYPKAGDPNPDVALGIVTAAGGAVKMVDLADYNEFLVQRVGWLKDSSAVYCYVLNRQQTWLDFNLCPTSGDKPSRLFRETTKAWVDDPGDPIFLADGSFLLPLERTGWKHIYRFEKTGKLRRQLTDGPWEVRNVVRTDEKAGWLYFMATKDSHVAENLYRVKLDGGDIERLTVDPGRHGCAFSPSGKYFIDSYSSHKTPGRTGLRTADGKLVRTIDSNPVRALKQYRLGDVSLVEIPCKDGFKLNGIVIKPPHFDPKRKYPVWFMTYGGPHTSTVFDSWQGGRGADQMLANLGIVVFRCDPRSASGKGAVSTWSCYRQLGVQELKDIEDAIDWLCQNSWIDSTRIGMTGHSYGGFMTAFALTHSTKFCAGIAGAPVTDWRNYDSIYTERFMDTPQNNPDGYAKTSVVKAARNLHGRLLLLHGAVDDNVHVQNSIQLIQALQLANKDFDMMLYPTARHGIFGQHYSRTIHEFIVKHLKVKLSADGELASGE